MAKGTTAPDELLATTVLASETKRPTTKTAVKRAQIIDL